ncbi:glycosyltransferase [Pedobacter punctiformis]|uniref:Glycosyltransferase n=1 Tax=Pedobacter punctiformis TaxID=3004097 RepID=A0ABT4L6N6_9SPHI|nr:glycosyltransferase [Pedobacter sp. HCMS5-2]MCZ4243491.1 glycosyltransferase [Pedobacter sp. HCMS5-2]
MISVIIASVDEKRLQDVKNNIEETIGVEYEIISFNNGGTDKLGLCEVYNDGAKAAKYNLLCFMHEDISIKTQNWGLEVVNCFKKNPKIGVLGIAGSAYKSAAPSGWFAESHHTNLLYCNYIQSFKNKGEESVHYLEKGGKSDIAQAVCVDGMWFCSQREIAIKHPFDQNLLKGFHGYDIDFCLNVIQNGYEVMVSLNILMEHFSEGGYSKSWFEDTLKLHDKWANFLPVAVIELPDGERNLIEKSGYKWILKKMVSMGYSFKDLKLFLKVQKVKGNLSNGSFLKYLYYGFKYSGSNQKKA